MLTGTGLFLRLRVRAENVPARRELSSLPLKLGNWMGRNLAMSAEVREVLGEGDFLTRLYLRRPYEPPVDLFIAYFPTQRTGSTIHSPQNCLPGSGWTPLERSRIQLSGPSGTPMTVNRYLISKGPDRELVLYWYQAHGRVVASEYWAKFFLVADTVRINRSDGALIRVTTPLARDESVESAQKRTEQFGEELVPLLKDYLPS